MICNLESIFFSCGRPAIEIESEVAERVSGLVGSDLTAVTANLVWNKSAACLKMTLHADFELAVAAEPRRIHNCLLDRLHGSSFRKPGANMRSARSVTALAIDSIRKIFRKDRLARNVEVRIFALQRKTVVAVEAFSWNSPAKVLLILGTVEARAHRPVSGFLCVPAHWHLDESAVVPAVQIGSHMVSGADDVVDLLLDYIRFLAVEP